MDFADHVRLLTMFELRLFVRMTRIRVTKVVRVEKACGLTRLETLCCIALKCLWNENYYGFIGKIF